MGTIGNPKKAKLFCGMIYSNEEIKQRAFTVLEKKLGKIDLISCVIPFDFSSYYSSEMGNNLKRFWVSFEELVSVAVLAEIKIFTNSIESSFALDAKRQINIDPGYITPANIVLATTKDYSHRIYLSSGIYGEVTIIYKRNGFIKLPWSYPDYLSKPATEFLLKARTYLMKQLKESNNCSS
ncbi:MAG: DUF4416 family protein [Endomicrobium sp.]|jgi:hypothetical protein|nr:DUF4416 family protein [Endomicrobium sp.]